MAKIRFQDSSDFNNELIKIKLLERVKERFRVQQARQEATHSHLRELAERRITQKYSLSPLDDPQDFSGHESTMHNQYKKIVQDIEDRELNLSSKAPKTDFQFTKKEQYRDSTGHLKFDRRMPFGKELFQVQKKYQKLSTVASKNTRSEFE